MTRDEGVGGSGRSCGHARRTRLATQRAITSVDGSHASVSEGPRRHSRDVFAPREPQSSQRRRRGWTRRAPRLDAACSAATSSAQSKPPPLVGRASATISSSAMLRVKYEARGEARPICDRWGKSKCELVDPSENFWSREEFSRWLDATLLNAPRRRQVIDRSRHRHHDVSAITLLREPRSFYYLE